MMAFQPHRWPLREYLVCWLPIIILPPRLPPCPRFWARKAACRGAMSPTRALAMAIAVFLASPVAGRQGLCLHYDQVVEILNDQDQIRRGRGLITHTEMLEIWENPETGDFTVLSVAPNGYTCILVSGTDWAQSKTKRLNQPGSEM